MKSFKMDLPTFVSVGVDYIRSASEIFENYVQTLSNRTDSSKHCSEVYFEELEDVLGEDDFENFKLHIDTSSDSFEITLTNENENSWPSSILNDLLNEMSNRDYFTSCVKNKLFINCEQKSPTKYQLHITYLHHEIRRENNGDSHLRGETFIDRIDPRIACAYGLGNDAVIELTCSSNTELDQRKLLRLVKYLQSYRKNFEIKGEENKNKEEEEDFDISGIVYSVSGRIPIHYKATNFHLTKSSLNFLIELTNENFYAYLIKRELLQVRTKPLDLKDYFKPLFFKVNSIRKFIVKSDNSCSRRGEFKNLIDLVIKEICHRVQEVALNVKLGANYLYHVTFLQHLYSSFILNKQEMSKFIEDILAFICEDELKEKLLKNYDNTRRFQHDWEVTISLKVTFSVAKAFTSVENSVKDCFIKTDNFAIDENLLRQKFRDEVDQEATTLALSIKESESVIQSYQNFMKKNIRSEIEFEFSMSAGTSSVSVLPVKNKVEMDPAYPILSCPQNIRFVKATENSLTIKWNFEADEHVSSYMVYYRCVSNELSSINGGVYSLHTDNARKKVCVSNIAPGHYVFRVQAQFEDILGAPSEESEAFYTSEIQPKEENVCSICVEEKNSIALIPCGHIFCETCSQQITICAICREPIKQNLKIFQN